jgi:hypothetical protein
MWTQRELLGTLAVFYLSTILYLMAIEELFAKERSQLRSLQILTQLPVIDRLK